MLKNKRGFTLVELLVVIFIIALISTLVTVSFLNIKRTNRDSKRISDITEIQTALENYKFFEGTYPSELISGEPLVGSSGNIYMTMVPQNPEYQSYDCPFSDYNYFYDEDDGKYKISFCLEGKIEKYESGEKCAISEGIISNRCIPLTILAGNPDNGQVDEVYAGHTFSALSGTSPYTFSLASGSSLPTGLDLASNGDLTGTPTTYGDYSFYIMVSDAESATSSREFSMTIDPVVLALGTSDPEDGYEGIAYAGHTFTASGGVAPYTFSLDSGSLPDGLSLASNGNLTGTPTTQDSYNFAIKVVDSILTEDVEDFSMNVVPPICGSYAVDYGGESYSTVQIGSQCWLQKNLNIGTKIDGSINQSDNSILEKYCYNNSESYCNFYGGLYMWSEAMQYIGTEGAQGICPSGWHIPRNSEFTTLVNYLGGSGTAGGKMKAITECGSDPCWNQYNISATNESGFTALGHGYKPSGGSFGVFRSHGYFWSSSTYSSGLYYNISLYNNMGSIGINMWGSGNALSIRCIRD
ncbi:MAG: FISUMP domain-containing protein [Patescibacteria group bacterium]|nr:FISUMP domain-containing protein [Patescibacteria group bacterium]